MLVHHLEQLTDLHIDIAIVIADGVDERVAGHMFGVLRVHVLPEGVMDAVDADLHQHEEVPGLRANPMVSQFEALLRHLVDLAEQPLFVFCAKTRYVHHILADERLDLGAQIIRVGKL